MNPYCNQWNVAITKIICLNSTCNLRRAYFAIKQINSISIVQKTIAKYHGNFAIKIQGPAKFTSNIQVNVSHRYIKWIILLWLLNKMENMKEWNGKNWFTPPILFEGLYFYGKYLGNIASSNILIVLLTISQGIYIFMAILNLIALILPEWI